MSLPETLQPQAEAEFLSHSSSLSSNIHGSAIAFANSHRLHRQLSAEAMWHRHVHH